MTPNPKPKSSPGAEDTQQFSAEDVKQAGLKQYRSPRNQQQQPQPQNVAVQITAMLVILAFFIALIIAGVVITLNIIH